MWGLARRASKRLHAPLRYLKTETPAAEVLYDPAVCMVVLEEEEEEKSVRMCVKGGGGELLGWRVGPPPSPPCQTVMLYEQPLQQPAGTSNLYPHHPHQPGCRKRWKEEKEHRQRGNEGKR